jgi:hypothetical protein
MHHNPELGFHLSRLGLLEALLVEFDISFDYDVQPLTSAKHPFAYSPFMLRLNSQLFLVVTFAFTYPPTRTSYVGCFLWN